MRRSVAFVNAEGVAVRVENHRHATDTGLDRFDAELHVFRAQMFDGLFKIFDFQRGGAAIGTRLEGRRGANGQRIRPEFVLCPLTVFGIIDGRWLQSKHVLVKLTGARHVRHGVTTKGEFNDFEHNQSGVFSFDRRETQLFFVC